MTRRIPCSGWQCVSWIVARVDRLAQMNTIDALNTYWKGASSRVELCQIELFYHLSTSALSNSSTLIVVWHCLIVLCIGSVCWCRCHFVNFELTPSCYPSSWPCCGFKASRKADSDRGMGKLDTSIVLNAGDVIVFQESVVICSKNAYDPVNGSCFVSIFWQDRAMYSSSQEFGLP